MESETKLHRVLRMGDNLSLGCFTVFIWVGIAGGLYTSITRKLSDGFLFTVVFERSPFLLIGSVAIGAACQRSARTRKFFIRLLLGSIGIIILAPLAAFLWQQASNKH